MPTKLNKIWVGIGYYARSGKLGKRRLLKQKTGGRKTNWWRQEKISRKSMLTKLWAHYGIEGAITGPKMDFFFFRVLGALVRSIFV
jgi:hypothetical protein